MPLYTYTNPKTGETIDVVQKMNDVHEYKRDGVTWKRVWLKPRMSVDSIPLDPYSSKDFARATNKAGTIGDLHSRSSELSAIRAQKDGVDPIREKYLDAYEVSHKGLMHPKRKEEKGLKKLADQGIIVDWGNDD